MLSNKLLFILGIVLFVVSFFIGTFLPSNYKNELYESFTEKAKSIINENNTSLSDLIVLPLKIFLNNFKVLLVIYALSVTIVGSWIFLMLQGLLTGAIATAPLVDLEMIKNIKSHFPQCTITQQDLIYVKASLLVPHGIFEISGIVLGLIASYHISTIIINVLRKKIFKKVEVIISAKAKILNSLKFVLFSVALLLFAAFIEVFITPIVGGVIIYILCLSK
ncbi:MAG: stage II sporulation protein M [Sulfolobales archaeon]